MTVSKKIHSITFPASGDLSSYQHRAMYCASDGEATVLTTGTVLTNPPVGILLNKPAGTARGAEVAITGSVVKMEAACAVDEGEVITPTTGGRGTPMSSGTAWAVGVALDAASGSAANFALLVQPAWIVKA